MHEYLLLTDIGNTVTEYGKWYSITIYKKMFGIFTEVINTAIGIGLSNAIKSVTKKINGYMESFALDS